MENINIEIELKVMMCYAGHAYAVPYLVEDDDYDCPVCSKIELQRLRQKIAHLNNIIRGLKGENTKLRGRT